MASLTGSYGAYVIFYASLVCLFILAAITGQLDKLKFPSSFNHGEEFNSTLVFSKEVVFSEEVTQGNETLDTEGPCDVRYMTTSLYNKQIPLTSEDVAYLRGCIVLLFFRNPRCGSTSLYFLFNELAKTQQFESHLGSPIKGDAQLVKPWVKFINARKEPIIAAGHWGAVDIITGVPKPPVIFDVIRHPIDHLMSLFKMAKYGDRSTKDSPKLARNKSCNESIDYYIQQKSLNISCFKGRFMGLQFLCGPCENCSKATCLQRAKTNLETIYLTVGLSENIPAFLTVMEALLPRFFKNAVTTYVNMSGLYQMISDDPYRNETLSAESVKYLKVALAEDLELYYLVQARFYVALRKVLEYNADSNLNQNSLLYKRVIPEKT